MKATAVDVCYCCLKELNEDQLSGCVVCGETLCLDLPTCSNKCRCNEVEHAVQTKDAVTV